MSAKRGTSGLSGVLVVDKPLGCTSHDVVNRIRRATGERRVGHAGTLDPAASGIVLILVGPYTRLEPYLSAKQKRYEARISFGSETDTEDAEGTVTCTSPTPATATDEQFAQSVLDGLLGDSLQQPPSYSAIKVAGQVAHRAARRGEALELAPRAITVLAARLLNVVVDADVSWVVDFTVSKGTYVRSLARDIGRAVGGCAHLGGLRRTAVGTVGIDQAHSLDEIEVAAARGRITDLFADAVELVGLPVVEVEEAMVLNGRPIVTGAKVESHCAIVVDGRLAAIYRKEGNVLRAEAVFPTPIGAAE